MRRRLWFSVALLLLAGCSSSSSATKKSRPRSATTRSATKGSKRSKAPKGPKTMGGLLVQGYIDDLKNGAVDGQIMAAKELGAMGADAKSALPALQPLTNHSDPKLREAAKQAIARIKK